MEKPLTKRETMMDIMRACAKVYDVKQVNILEKKRGAKYIEPRQVAQWLCREVLKYKANEIGKVFKRDHSSVLNAQRRINDRVDKDTVLRARIDAVVRELKGIENPSKPVEEAPPQEPKLVVINMMAAAMDFRPDNVEAPDRAGRVRCEGVARIGSSAAMLEEMGEG